VRESALYTEFQLETARRLGRELSGAHCLACGEPEENERAWLAAEQALLESEPERLARFGDAAWSQADEDERRS